jgi:hypothetical protein
VQRAQLFFTAKVEISAAEKQYDYYNYNNPYPLRAKTKAATASIFCHMNPPFFWDIKFGKLLRVYIKVKSTPIPKE